MKMKKKEPAVAYILTKLELGGAQKVCLSLLDGAKKEGTTSYLISGAEGILVDKVRSRDDVHLLSSFQREITPKSIYQEAVTFFSIVKILRQLKKKHPDLIVHTHSTKAGIIGRWAAFFAGVKKRVHTIHNFGFHPYQNRLFWTLCYLAELVTSIVTTHYVCVSSENVKTALRLLPRFKKRHTIIRAAVDWQTFYQPAQRIPDFPQAEEPFIFGAVACFKAPKNLLDLFKAFEYAYRANTNIRLEIVGDGTLRPVLEQWIVDHKLQSVITLHGWQHHVAPIMLTWHAFVLSSLWEGLPCAVVEARLLKLPVISYKTGGIPDIITDGENGLLFEKKDWRGLADGMLKLATNKSIHQAFNTYSDNLTDFNDQVMVQQHIRLYKQLSH